MKTDELGRFGLKLDFRCTMNERKQSARKSVIRCFAGLSWKPTFVDFKINSLIADLAVTAR